MGRHSTRYPAEVRERAVRLVFEHQGEYGSQWEAMCSIAAKFGCTAETLRRWVRQAERDSGARPGMASDDRERVYPPSYAVFLRATEECLATFDDEMEVAAWLAFEKLTRDQVEVVADRPWLAALTAWE